MSDDSNENGNTEAVIPGELRDRSQAEPGGGRIDPVGGIVPGDALDGGPAAAGIPEGVTTMPDESSSHSGFNNRQPVYLEAREKAFARSGGLCQLCGQEPAVETHHWAQKYPPAHKTTADALTALCVDCHYTATTLRRFTRAGGSRHQFRAVLSEVIARCDLNSPLPASPPSSCTTERPDSTREALPAARSQRSRPSGAGTGPTSTTSGSASSSASGPSISERTASPRYRRQRFGQ